MAFDYFNLNIAGVDDDYDHDDVHDDNSSSHKLINNDAAYE